MTTASTQPVSEVVERLRVEGAQRRRHLHAVAAAPVWTPDVDPSTAGRPHVGVGYLRISSTDDALGVQRQYDDVARLASTLDVHIAAWYVDNDRSAFRGKMRPDYRRMIEALSATGAATFLLSWHSDRITRTPSELEALIVLVEQRRQSRHKLRISTLHTGEMDLNTAGGRAMARQLITMGAYESEIKSERQQAKQRQLREAGVSGGGGRPYGYETGGMRLHVDEARIVRLMVDGVLSGDGCTTIAKRLNAMGIPSGRGGLWSNLVVRNLLRNPRIAGLRTHKGEIVGEARWPAIITLDEHRRVRALVDDPARKGRRGKQPRLLTGVLVCGKCGVKMVGGRASMSRGGQPVYRCGRHVGSEHGCNANSILALPVEHQILQAMSAHARTIVDTHDDSAEVTVLAELAAIERERVELDADVERGELSHRLAAAAERGLDARQSDAEARLRQHARPTSIAAQGDTWATLIDGWDDLTIERQRAIVGDLIVSVEIGASTGGKTVDLSRVGEPDWRHPVKG